MFCPKCGTRSDNSRFCRSCGTNLALISDKLSKPQQSHMQWPRGGRTRALFSSTTMTNEGGALDGRNIESIFGQVTIDLTMATLPPGETKINFHIVFGTIDVCVPEDVGVRITGVSVLSGIKVRGRDVGSGVRSVNEYTTPGYSQSVRQLHIEAKVVFGTINIKP